jgi:curli biogenesis system outer membrane secretion channel CsgG
MLRSQPTAPPRAFRTALATLLAVTCFAAPAPLCLAAPAEEKADLYRQTERAKDLVVWITGESDGAAVAFHVEGTTLYAMTAKHVIWLGGPIAGLKAKLRPWPAKTFDVEPDKFHYSHDFATVKIDLAALGLDEGGIRRALPFDLLGDPGQLEPGAPTYPVGHSSADNWLSPESPATFNSFDKARETDRTKDVLRVEQHCPEGHSGGALFDGDWHLIGILFDNTSGYCRALRIDWALSALQHWKYDSSLTRPPAVAKASAGPEEIKVAVVSFDNRSGASLPEVGSAAQDVIGSYLVDLPRVVLLTRDRLESVREEMGLAGTQRSAEDLTRFGRLLNADAIVTGSVLRYDVERRAFSGHGAQATVDVYRMDISLMIVDVETGRVTFSRIYDTEDRRTSYPDNQSGGSAASQPVAREAELLRRLLDEAVGELREGLTKLAMGLPATGQVVSVSITSEPPGADVVVGGIYQGATPLSIELSVGLQEVEIDRPGYHQWLNRVKVEPGLRIHASLQRIGS